MHHAKWIFLRLLSPFLIAAVLPLSRHICPNSVVIGVLLMLFLPAFTALFHVATSGFEQPPRTISAITPAYRRYQAAWSICTAIAIIILMIFDFMLIAAYITNRADLFYRALLITYLPYASLSIAARWSMSKCYLLAAADLLNTLGFRAVCSGTNFPAAAPFTDRA